METKNEITIAASRDRITLRHEASGAEVYELRFRDYAGSGEYPSGFADDTAASSALSPLPTELGEKAHPDDFPLHRDGTVLYGLPGARALAVSEAARRAIQRWEREGRRLGTFTYQMEALMGRKGEA